MIGCPHHWTLGRWMWAEDRKLSMRHVFLLKQVFRWGQSTPPSRRRAYYPEIGGRCASGVTGWGSQKNYSLWVQNSKTLLSKIGTFFLLWELTLASLLRVILSFPSQKANSALSILFLSVCKLNSTYEVAKPQVHNGHYPLFPTLPVAHVLSPLKFPSLKLNKITCLKMNPKG